MVVKVAATCLNWPQPSVPHSPSSSQALASAISSPSSKRRRFTAIDGALFSRYRSAFFGAQPSNLYRSRSNFESSKFPRGPNLRRAVSSSSDSFSDEEFAKKLQEIAMKFQLSDESDPDLVSDNTESRNQSGGATKFFEKQRQFNPLQPPDWPESVEIIPASIERKANSVDLPVSLWMIRKKKQWREGFREAGESAYCSVKKAFSSMVFIIRELQSYTLQMREVLYYEDLQGILEKVQKEMNASFVWLFQQVFSHTPTLMVYVMILLANYSVHSMANSAALAAAPPPQPYQSESVLEDQNQFTQKFDSSVNKSFSVSSTSGKTTSIGGGNGGGGFRRVAGGTEGEGRSDGSVSYHRTIVPDGVSSVGRISEEESVSTEEEIMAVWDAVVEEAEKMRPPLMEAEVDHETMRRFVSPVNAKIEEDDYENYSRTEMMYQMGLDQDPNNSLLLANFAQFLFLVAQDYDRAEEYFKKAVESEPKDAEALNKYATFLWKARNDLWAAEETYQEAIAADPENSFYAANYANFLWSTGGEDTCFPLSSPQDT